MATVERNHNLLKNSQKKLNKSSPGSLCAIHTFTKKCLFGIDLHEVAVVGETVILKEGTHLLQLFQKKAVKRKGNIRRIADILQTYG